MRAPEDERNGSDPMYARRIFAAAAIAIATASATACGGSPTGASNLAGDGGKRPAVPDAPPTDTTGFIPPSLVP
jgi:hypothetical protein